MSSAVRACAHTSDMVLCVCALNVRAWWVCWFSTNLVVGAIVRRPQIYMVALLVGTFIVKGLAANNAMRDRRFERQHQSQLMCVCVCATHAV